MNKKNVEYANDFAEYFISSSQKKIKSGTAVVLENGMVRPAEKGEIPIGVISANPGIVVGLHPEWPHKYLRDEFGAAVMEKSEEEIMVPKKQKVKRERQKIEKKTIEEEIIRTEIVYKKNKPCQVEKREKVTREVEAPVFKEVDLYDEKGETVIGKHRVPEMEAYDDEIGVLDDKGSPVLVGSGKFARKERLKQNLDYDQNMKYVTRDMRPEWNCVGLIGQIPLRKGQPVAPTWVKIKDISDDVEMWLVK